MVILSFSPQAESGPSVHHLACEPLQLPLNWIPALGFSVLCFWKAKNKKRNPNWIIQWIITDLLEAYKYEPYH